MITGATVALVPSPKAVALAVLGYPGMPEAADAVPGLLPHRPVAVEGMDARLVDVFRARRGAAAVPALPRGESWLFVETAGDTEAEARAAVTAARRRRRLPRLAGGHRRPGAGAVAHPRGRRGPERPHPGGRAGLARLGGRRRPARSPGRVPA